MGSSNPISIQKHTCFLNVLGQKDTIDFKNEATFPRYKTLLSYKVIKQSRSWQNLKENPE